MIIEIIWWFFFIYSGQLVITCLFNASNGTRLPENYKDFILLTFLPYAMFNYKKIKRDKKDE